MSNLLEKASVILTPTAYNTSEALCVKPSDGTGDFDFSRATDATRINSLGLIETIGINLPRINYEGGCGSWLFEPQSTNSVFQSNLLAAISGGIVTPNAAISPDGTTNAIKVNFGTGSNSGGSISVGGGSASASTEYTISFYAKNFSGDGTFRLRLDTDTQTALVNETFVATSEWVRYTHTFTTDAAASSFGSSSRFRKSTTTDNNEVLFFGIQLEQQSYATSYIPTDGSTVTRNQDVCTNGGSLASINSTEGVLYFEGSALQNGGNLNRIISISDETNDNLVQFRFDVTANRITSYIRGNGGSYALKTIVGFTQTNNNKVALVWNATNLRIWINGTESGSVSTNDLPIAMDTLSFTQPTGGSNFFSKTKCLAVWKEALTDAELTSLTTI